MRITRLLPVILCAGMSTTSLSQDDSSSWTDDVRFFSHRRPMIGMYYGASSGSLQDFPALAKPGIGELRLGGVKSSEREDNTVATRVSYVILANLSTRLRSGASGTETEAEQWRFGPGWEKGYGYGSPGVPDLILYNGNGFTWTQLHVRRPSTFPLVPVPLDPAPMVDRFEGGFRFGTRTEGGVRVRVSPFLLLDAAYERALIFPRHLVWKWGGSLGLEAACHWALDEFIERIGETSPAAVPVVNFVLRNGLSYAVYQLRRTAMNYPFSSEAPLVNDSFKVGVAFVF